MVKTKIDLDYLKQDEKIKKSLKFSRASEKSIKTKFSALDKFFPYLIEFFEIDETFDLDTYLSKKINETNEIKVNWLKKGIVNKVWEEWGNLDEEERANLLMMWIDKQQEGIKNTYRNYIWRIQGLFKLVNKDWLANPENMEKIEPSPLHLNEEENITFPEVGEIYNKLSAKYKMALKIMVYTGLNPADIVELKPIDFQTAKNIKLYGDKTYYYVNKKRVKGKRKNVMFLQVYTEEFMKEIIAYFEKEKILKYNKTKQANKVEQLIKDSRFEIAKDYKNFIEFKGKRDWENDKKENIFGNIKSTAISDAFRYQNNGKVGAKVQPATIRRMTFSRIAPLFTQSQLDKDIYNLWTQHKVGVLGASYMTKLISNIIEKLKKGSIQSAVLLGNMGDYIKETITLRKKFDDIETLKVENKELRNELDSMKQLNKEEMNNLRNEMFSMIQELGYKNELTDNVKKGKITSEEAKAEYLGLEKPKSK